MIRYHHARLSDAGGIARVHTLGWQQSYEGLMPANFLAERVIAPELWAGRLGELSDGTTVWVAEDDDEVVGFCLVGPDADPQASPDRRRGRLYALYVLADHWGAGVGHRLHREGIRALIDAGFASAVLWVLHTNTRAIAFYERQGWRDEHVCTEEDVGGFVAREKRLGLDLGS